MEPELERDQEELNKMFALQYEIKEAIADEIRRKGANAEEVNVKGVKVSIEHLLDNDEDNTTYYKAESEHKSYRAIAYVKKKSNSKKINVDVDFDIQAAHRYLDEKRMEKNNLNRRIKREQINSKEDSSDSLKSYLDQKIKDGKAQPIELFREVTHSRNVNQMLKGKFKEDFIQLYRVKGKDNHDYKFIGKTRSGKWKELDFLTKRHEGRNSLQKLWVMKNGELKEITVDSLLLKGNYGLATDFTNNVVTQNTTTYVVQRLPNGQYLGIAAAQKSGVERTPKSDDFQKDAMSNKSPIQMQSTVEAANAAQQIYAFIKDNKLTTEEVQLVKDLKREKNWLTDKEVGDIADTIISLKELGFKCDEIKNMMVKIKDADELEKIAKSVEEVKQGNSGRDGGQKEHVMGPRVNPRTDY